jgi:hypothetical protein
MYHGKPLILKSGKFGKINRRTGEGKTNSQGGIIRDVPRNAFSFEIREAQKK